MKKETLPDTLLPLLSNVEVIFRQCFTNFVQIKQMLTQNLPEYVNYSLREESTSCVPLEIKR